jgi:hypothetical protein
MNRVGSRLVIAVFALVIAVGCSPTAKTSTTTSSAGMEADVDSLFQSYVDALNRADSTAASEVFAPGLTAAGREQFFRGSGSLARTAGESPLSLGQNQFDIDTLQVIPIENNHALALVIYTVDPNDQDVPAFHTTGTYVLEKTGGKWRIIHAHVCPAREM